MIWAQGTVQQQDFGGFVICSHQKSMWLWDLGT